MRHAHAKLGVAKTAAIATATVTATVGVTTAVVLATTGKPAPHPPVVAVTASRIATTTAASSSSPSPTPTALTLGVLTGDWISHHGGLTIAADGTFIVEVRNEQGSFNDMYRAEGHLTSATGTAADGILTKTDWPEGFPPGPVHISFASDTHTVDFVLGKATRTFCSHSSPAGYCGA